MEALKDFMIVFLDTSELRAKSKHDSSIKSLQRLALNGHINLLLPYIIEMEYRTQSTGSYSKTLNDIHNKLQELTPKGNPNLKRKFDSYSKKTAIFTKNILKQVENDVDKFLDSLNPIRIELNQKIAKNALEAYFTGSTPYKKVKAREDIPDSFAFESLRSYLPKAKKIYVVTRDQKLGVSLSALDKEKIIVFSDSDELIAFQDFQEKFANEFVHKNLYSIGQSLRSNKAKLKDRLYKELETRIPFETFYRGDAELDSNEVLITSTSNIDKECINFDFDNLTDYGGGEVVIPFSAEIEVLGDFYLNKFEYYNQDRNFLSIKDQNDHVYEVEDEFSVKVSGLLTIDIETPPNGKGVLKASMIKYNSAKVDSSFEIEFSE